jgi:prefoldin subunit 5
MDGAYPVKIGKDPFIQVRPADQRHRQYMLTNWAYVGKKEINKQSQRGSQEELSERQRYRIVDAVWEPIVPKETFDGAQKLLRTNGATKHNVTKQIKHSYLLNSGLLWCENCGSEMEGRSGTSHRGSRYYYYACKNRDCRFRLPADEIERVVLNRIKTLSTSKDILGRIVDSTNRRLLKELPQLREKKKVLQGELSEINTYANDLLDSWATLSSTERTPFLKDKLDQLGATRKELERSIEAIDQTIREITQETVQQESVAKGLKDFTAIFEASRLFERRELLRSVLHKAILSPDSMKMALLGHQIPIERPDFLSRFQTSAWWAHPDSNQEPAGYEPDALPLSYGPDVPAEPANNEIRSKP